MFLTELEQKISNEYLQINKEIKDKKYICDYDCDIKTGSIV